LGGEVLGLFSSAEINTHNENEIETLINQRNDARSAKDWKKSDSIRDQLASMGVEIQDTTDGTIWKLV